jgi:S1-C subfamily serine protease
MPHGVTPTAVIRERLAAMRQGKVVGTVSLFTEEWLAFEKALLGAKALPIDRWSQGEKTRAAFRGVVAKARQSVVEVLDADEVVALGTVVEAGFVLTKASEIPAEPGCRLPDGKVVPALVVGVDPAFDVALLRVKAEGLLPVQWASAEPAVGSLLAAPGAGALPLVVGVMGVASRDLKMPGPKEVTRSPRGRPAPPEVLGSTVEGRGYWVEFVDGAAASAGIRAGDVITAIGDAPVRAHADLTAAVAGRWAGERVVVRLLRGASPLTVQLRLVRARRYLFSVRADAFPTVFEHDLPLLATECGGPVVGLDGRAVGVTIARVQVHGCMAVPADWVRRLLPALKAGKPLAALSGIPAAARRDRPQPKAEAPPGKPATRDVEEIKRRLKERGARFRSLLVDYETREEALLDPLLVMSWGLPLQRDHRERHRFAFSGQRRLFEQTKSAMMASAVPAHLVAPAPEAPPDVARRIREARRLEESNRVANGVAQLYLVNRRDAQTSRAVFDGKDSWQQPFAGAAARRVNRSIFFAKPVYLEGLGLRPVNPNAPAEGRKMQERLWFPGNFAAYEKCAVRPQAEGVDGAACVVVDAEYSATEGQKTVRLKEVLWLDPALGYAPRRWETHADGVLRLRRTNADFEEFAPGCWLPWQASVEHGAPAWVPAAYRNRPTDRVAIRLRRAVVNEVKEEWFRP